jgi:hypothetical protein
MRDSLPHSVTSLSRRLQTILIGTRFPVQVSLHENRVHSAIYLQSVLNQRIIRSAGVPMI